jgi:threonine dehydrogenase-like Zn-dependent dehydrogenase
LTLRNGQCHVQKYWSALLEKVESGSFDPSFAATHHMPLSKAPEAYKTFLEKRDGVMKIILKP